MPENATVQPNIDSILQEQRKFECPAEFSQQAHITVEIKVGRINGKMHFLLLLTLCHF